MFENILDTKLAISSALGIVVGTGIIGSWKILSRKFDKLNEWRTNRAQSYFPIISYENGVSITSKKTPWLMRIGLHLSYGCKRIFKYILFIAALTLIFFLIL